MTAARSIWHLSKDGSSDRYELRLDLPIRTKSEANARDHYMAKARRVAKQRGLAELVVTAALHGSHANGHCDVYMTRRAPSGGLDDDNLRSALKAVRDGIADALGVSDRDPHVRWHYDQARSKPKTYAVEVRIVRGAA